MKLKAIVKPNAKIDEILQTNDGTLLIRVVAPPTEGKANKKVIELLANYFKTSKRNISIVAGLKGRDKIIEIV
jgi:uncharacterized protein (TIGR00251 family)